MYIRTHTHSCTTVSRDTNHVSQSDLPFVIPNFVMRWGKFQPARDQKESFSLNMEVCHSFFGRHLLEGEFGSHFQTSKGAVGVVTWPATPPRLICGMPGTGLTLTALVFLENVL